jgi:hypothetical protein
MLSTDSALASFLGIKPNTVAMWKKRGFLDFNLIFTKCDDIDPGWILTGEGYARKEDAKHDVVCDPRAPFGPRDLVIDKIVTLLKDMPEESRLEILRSVEEKKLLRELMEERKKL